MIKRLFGLFRRIVLLLVICAVAAGGFLVYEGYQVYEEALLETPVEQVMAEIQNQPHYTTLEQIPQIYIDAVISTEDHRFYVHSGLDVIAIARALWHDIQAGKMVVGGSTITQQLAKNQFFTQKKELTRKIAEVFMVRQIEKLYEKDEILELYINSIYYGEGYYCIYDASMGYFGKEPAALNAQECTLLAGIPNAPSVYAPTANPDLALQRQRQVVQDMVTWGYLTREEAVAILPQS